MAREPSAHHATNDATGFRLPDETIRIALAGSQRPRTFGPWSSGLALQVQPQ